MEKINRNVGLFVFIFFFFEKMNTEQLLANVVKRKKGAKAKGMQGERKGLNKINQP